MNTKKMHFRAGKTACASRLNLNHADGVFGQTSGRLRAAIAFGTLALLIAGCAPKAPVSAPADLSSSTSQSASASASPSETSLALTACTSEKATEQQGGEDYVCTMDEAGMLVWMESSASKKLMDERAAAAALIAAKKAAEQKAAAEKLAAQKAAAAKAAAQKAAAERAAAEKRAAEAAAAQAAAAAAAAAQQQAAQQQAQQSSCDPNYTGACVPIASDVDCAGGSGNGPAYVQGPVRVVGSDIYGLDRDGDGIGCE